jgi:RimJ/RimL family protein N-acetyltransferase
VQAVLDELQQHCHVQRVVAVLKARNYRSAGLLRKLGFVSASAEQVERYRDLPDEAVMVKVLTGGENPA